MSAQKTAVVDILEKSRRVFERLADEFDRSRLRESTDMRRQVLAALDVVEPALAAQRCIQAAVWSQRAARPPEWRQAQAAADLQRDQISSLVKDMRVLASGGARYRPEHVGALAFMLAKALREHLSHEQGRFRRPTAARGAQIAALGALRRVEAMLGRL
ncbi:MAG: hypothetical protein HYZ75_03330 [Elusimicrobia bacterium]|nr:hypothetical protein [Elusimicrobiota bacterium]